MPGQDDRLVLVGSDLQVEHVVAPTALGTGPVDGRNAVAIRERSRDEGVVTDRRPGHE